MYQKNYDENEKTKKTVSILRLGAILYITYACANLTAAFAAVLTGIAAT